MDIIFFVLFVALLTLMVVGLLSPDDLTPITRRKLTLQQIVAIFGGGAVVCFVVFLLITPQPQPAPLPDLVEDDGIHEVLRIIDGDTIEVRYGEELRSVRLIGIDAPEVARQGGGFGECFGDEATERMRKLVEDELVRLMIDRTQDARDRFGRLLRYVYIDEDNVSETLILEGYAYEYTHERPYAYQERFMSLEAEAREANRGLWSGDACAGQRSFRPGDLEGVVKMSSTGICHAPGTTYYEITINFTPFESLQDCLANDGRLPVR